MNNSIKKNGQRIDQDPKFSFFSTIEDTKQFENTSTSIPLCYQEAKVTILELIWNEEISTE